MPYASLLERPKTDAPDPSQTIYPPQPGNIAPNPASDPTVRWPWLALPEHPTSELEAHGIEPIMPDDLRRRTTGDLHATAILPKVGERALHWAVTPVSEWPQYPNNVPEMNANRLAPPAEDVNTNNPMPPDEYVGRHRAEP